MASRTHTALVVLPARYTSTRLPGKPLLDRTGKPLIQHVWETVRRAHRVDRVVIATDDERILKAAEGFGAEAQLTAATHPSGTDRVAEVVQRMAARGETFDLVVNVQGDEPELPPEAVDRVVQLLSEDAGADMATLAVPMADLAESEDPHRVKVVLDGAGRALYFSRAPIPYDRDGGGRLQRLRHIGIYGYRAEVLRAWPGLPPSRLEQVEGLEQLRALAAGYKIRVGITDLAWPGVDTPADYEAFVQRALGSGKK